MFSMLRVLVITSVADLGCFGYEFFHPGSRVKEMPDTESGSASQNLITFKPKIVNKLSEICSGSRILIFPHPR